MEKQPPITYSSSVDGSVFVQWTAGFTLKAILDTNGMVLLRMDGSLVLNESDVKDFIDDLTSVIVKYKTRCR